MAMQTQKRPNVYQREFVQELAESAKISEVNARILTEKFLQTLAVTLVEKQSICFPEFGIFELRETSERIGRNPRTMVEYTIPAGLKPVFRPSRIFRESLNKVLQERAAESMEQTMELEEEAISTRCESSMDVDDSYFDSDMLAEGTTGGEAL